MNTLMKIVENKDATHIYFNAIDLKWSNLHSRLFVLSGFPMTG